MTEPWQRRMEHERAWRDAGVELGLRSPPQGQDGPGSLALAGPLRRTNSALHRLFLAKGHTAMRFDACRCHGPPTPNAPARGLRVIERAGAIPQPSRPQTH